MTIDLRIRTVRRSAAAILVSMSLALAGCTTTSNQQGPINPTLPVGLPPTPSPASSNSFSGTQGPGLWSVQIDDTQQKFSYQALTYPLSSPSGTVNGTFLPTIGFQALTNPGTGAGGYMVEVPGRAAFLNPGDDTTAPVFAVEQDSCFPINGSVRFQFVSMPNQLTTTLPPAYGRIDVQTSADGSTWNFGGQAQYVLPYTLGAPGIGVPIQPGTTVGVELSLPAFQASCSVSNGNAMIKAASNVSSITPVSTAATTFVIGPTGFFLEDQSTGKQSSAQNPDAPSYIGVVEPSSALVTSSIVAPKYVGFMREALFNGSIGKPISITQPIGFGQIVAGSGTSMTGGSFLNDDITQFQNSNIVLNLGTEDSKNNGLYPLASLTVPDPTNVCFIDPTQNKIGAAGTPGVDPYGNETCTFNVVAIVGNPENKYAIFVRGTDVVTGNEMGIYLFQQQ